ADAPSATLTRAGPTFSSPCFTVRQPHCAGRAVPAVHPQQYCYFCHLAHLRAVSGSTAGMAAEISAGYPAGVLLLVFMVAGIQLATGPDGPRLAGAGHAACRGGPTA